ncbi:GIY-YIG nuclease family protein [Kitasatospora cineracea]
MYEDNCAHLGWCNNPFHTHGDESARLSRLVDAEEPAFDHIAEVLTEMCSAGVEFTAELVRASVKIGRDRYRRESPTKIIPAPRRGETYGSVVYYIRRGNLIKIGTTINLAHRMNALMPDEILAIEPGGKTEEAERHQEFASLRTAPRSEYFFPGVALQRHVSQLRLAHGAPPAGLPTLKGASKAWARDFEDGVEI